MLMCPGKNQADYISGPFFGWYCNQTGWCSNRTKAAGSHGLLGAISSKDRATIQLIGEATVGIIFLGTPHRGSEKASYGKVLAKVATTVMHKPAPALVNALRANSDALMRLTTDFRFQMPQYQVCSFYEMKPMRIFSSLVGLQPLYLSIYLKQG